MSDLGEVIAVWREAELSGEDFVLATIVGVEGSSYRKPGARMIVTKSGRRAGTLSGGCMEGEVAKKAWWLTEHGPTVESYTTRFDIDGDIPFGSGCGGTIRVLLERRRNALDLMQALARAFDARVPVAMATVLDGVHVGRRVIAGVGNIAELWESELREFASRALVNEKSETAEVEIESSRANIWVEYVPGRTGLFLFGAGDDVRPLVTQARTLGWHITVGDGRSNLATQERFAEADRVVVLERLTVQHLGIKETDAVVLMTHSWEQDRELLRQMLPRPLTYLGVLGPRQRTVQLVAEVLSGSTRDVGESMRRIWAPVGMDIGNDTPAKIALSILAEIQATLTEQRRLAKKGNFEGSRALRSAEEIQYSNSTSVSRDA
jgi:xanthine dehydrogenase accessory factor